MRHALFFALVLTNCTHDRTETVIGFATDLLATSMIDRVQFTATRQGVPLLQQSWDLSGKPAQPYELPGSYGVFADDGTQPRFDLLLTGYHGGTQLVEQAATLTLVERQTLFYRMTLVERCVAKKDCTSEESCVEGRCRPRVIDMKTLPIYATGMEGSIACSNGTKFINTSTGDPMPLVGSGCRSDQECIAGTCYKKPATPESFVTTIAGTGQVGAKDGPNGQATFNQPSYMAFDSAGNIALSEVYGNHIRQIGVDGMTRTLAGSGQPGFAEGPGTSARFNEPEGIAYGPTGVLYVADYMNNRIRAVAADPVHATTTLAGSGSPMTRDGIGAAAGVNAPLGIAYVPSANAFYVTQLDGVIRKMTLDGMTTTVAGTAGMKGHANGPGASAVFSLPWSITSDGQSLFVVDFVGVDGLGNQSAARIRRISLVDGKYTVSDFAGDGMIGHADGKPGEFHGPFGLAVQSNGNLWVSDAYNQTVRMITPAGVVSSPTGSNPPGFADGPLVGAQFSVTWGIAIDRGRVYVADAGNNRIRAFDLSP